MDLKEELDKKLDRLAHRKNRLEEQELKVIERNEKLKESGSTLTEHAGWDVGYVQGQLSIVSEWEDFINDLKKLTGANEK